MVYVFGTLLFFAACATAVLFAAHRALKRNDPVEKREAVAGGSRG
jgi:hypothetical protein